jgi:hypothetical protein
MVGQQEPKIKEEWGRGKVSTHGRSDVFQISCEVIQEQFSPELEGDRLQRMQGNDKGHMLEKHPIMGGRI